MPTSPVPVRTTARIRQEFFDFFRDRHAHALVASSPVVPHDDPTLLFTNAGMNQFKDVFLGRSEPPSPRVVDSQKCIRAGGKHNDLEDVGKDGHHHTFFEMLGNWSFGDYFKPEAIEWAWTLLTDVWGLDKSRLYATVFEGDAADSLDADTEAEAIWHGLLPADQVSRWGRKDNFWEMGDTGPCGPCSEIHYDGRPDEERRALPGAKLVNRDHPDVVEVWNLVFIQYDRSPAAAPGDRGPLRPLPARHVDTGMGLERLVRVLQGRRSNYDTDLWQPLFRAIAAHTGAHPYRGVMDDPVDIAYRVIADHVRCLTVAISDGARPGNEGRGYVLRRILRRAVRHAHQTLDTKGAWVHELVPVVADTLGAVFPELRSGPDAVAAIIKDEEESFLRTLDRGIALFDEAAGRARDGGVSADDAFRLHDTFGFPIDLTRVMAEERGMSVDEAGYARLMEEARARSRRGDGGDGDEELTLPADAIAKLKAKNVAPTPDVDKYHGRPLTAKVAAIWNGGDFDLTARTGRPVAVILSRTNHYAEAGGQVGDRGTIATDVVDAGQRVAQGAAPRETTGDTDFLVEHTRAVGGYVLHIGRVSRGTLRVGDHVTVTVDRKTRRPTMANHTATHLLNHALRAVLGDDVDQKGSLVAPDRLRFDFTCAHPMTVEQIEAVDAHVNDAIARDLEVHADVVPLADAMKINGLRAVFGERYPDPVRVVSIGAPVADLVADPESAARRDHSIELCGGTHLSRTEEAKRFLVGHEQALAAGVRRVLALTGPAAMAADAAGRDLEARATEAEGLEGDELVTAHDDIARLVDEMTIGAAARARIRARLEPLRERIKAIRKSARSAARSDVVDQARAIAEAGDGPVVVDAVTAADPETLRSALDAIRAKRPDAAAMLFASDEEAGKVSIVAAVPKPLIGRGLKAGDWVRTAAKVCGGGGGGRDDRAQAGGKDPSKVAAAVDAARSFAEEKLS